LIETRIRVAGAVFLGRSFDTGQTVGAAPYRTMLAIHQENLRVFEISGGEMADQELDARGLNCPLPILRAKKALNDLGGGQTLKIVATDPGSVKDFQAFAKQTGNELLESSEAGGEFVFLIQKKA
jgi:tRNA 2-thiouridine synthesizing protein A